MLKPCLFPVDIQPTVCASIVNITVMMVEYLTDVKHRYEVHT